VLPPAGRSSTDAHSGSSVGIGTVVEDGIFAAAIDSVAITGEAAAAPLQGVAQFMMTFQ
jgi:hypothetical protein